MIEPNHVAKVADIAMPALRRPCFDRQPCANRGGNTEWRYSSACASNNSQLGMDTRRV